MTTPFVGAVYQARTRSGRLWQVASRTKVRCGTCGARGKVSDPLGIEMLACPTCDGRGQVEGWNLDPLGDDVRPARSGTTGLWQGGVRSLQASTERLQDPSRWRFVR